MATTNFESPWLFVVDTEDYAGNFERDLCAYITGHVGECGVGDDMAALFTAEVGEPLDNVVDEMNDDGNCLRPVSIYPSPVEKYDYNSAAISFEKKPTLKQIKLMKKRAHQFAKMSNEWAKDKPRISKIIGFRLISNKVERSHKAEGVWYD